MKSKPERVPITEKALIGRLNRALAKDGLRLKATRHDSPWFGDLGRYYAVSGNVIHSCHVDLAQWAAELGVIHPYERLERWE